MLVLEIPTILTTLEKPIMWITNRLLIICFLGLFCSSCSDVDVWGDTEELA
jgi:hypothetical protein